MSHRNRAANGPARSAGYFAALGTKLGLLLNDTPSLPACIESAKTALWEDDMVAFTIGVLREAEDGVQMGSGCSTSDPRDIDTQREIAERWLSNDNTIGFAIVIVKDVGGELEQQKLYKVDKQRIIEESRPKLFMEEMQAKLSPVYDKDLISEVEANG